MPKVKLGPMPLVYPMPALLIGANIDGTPDFMAAAWCGISNGRPLMISVGLQHHRHTLKGIFQNKSFSVNVPSIDLVKKTDYCGIVSGTSTDKVSDCRFNVFYGKLEEAPLIEQCPVNLECSVVHMLNLGSHMLVIGQVREVHVTDSCLTDGKPDVDKIRPFLFVTEPEREYREFGKPIGKAFSIGKEIRP